MAPVRIRILSDFRPHKGRMKAPGGQEHDKEVGRQEVEGGRLGQNVKPQMSITEEKDALFKRIAELERKEKLDLESQLRDKKEQLETTQNDFKSKKSKVQSELNKLEAQVAGWRNVLSKLGKEEKERVQPLQLEISRLANEISKRTVKEQESLIRDVQGSLECPVCYDICKPPTQIWQCPEGHIVCGSCADRPELTICPQCRVPLSGQMSRNRALEELARKTFPGEQETEAGARTPPLQARGAPRNNPDLAISGNQLGEQDEVEEVGNFHSTGTQFQWPFDFNSLATQSFALPVEIFRLHGAAEAGQGTEWQTFGPGVFQNF